MSSGPTLVGRRDLFTLAVYGAVRLQALGCVPIGREHRSSYRHSVSVVVLQLCRVIAAILLMRYGRWRCLMRLRACARVTDCL